MSVLSKLSIAASKVDNKVKKLLFDLFDTSTSAATGSSQSTGTLLTANTNLVTDANGTKVVVLPPAVTGMAIRVVNTVSTSDLPVYPSSGDNINGAADDAAFTIPGGQEATFYSDVNSHWYVRVGYAALSSELDVLNGASATNDTAGKAAILGTAGAVSFGGVVTTTGLTVGTAVLAQAELELLDDVTAGTSAPSKVLTTDAAESLVWATTDATASETVTLSVADTRTGPGATGWAIKGDLISDVALGSYANGIYGILSLGSSGKVTGLGAGVVAEIVMSAGCTDGTYAGLEVEVGMPANAITGTATSLMYLGVYGAAASAFDDSGFVMNLSGLTTGSSKAFANNCTVTNVNELTHGLKIKVGADTYYIPLVAAAAFQA